MVIGDILRHYLLGLDIIGNVAIYVYSSLQVPNVERNLREQKEIATINGNNSYKMYDLHLILCNALVRYSDMTHCAAFI